MPSNRQFLFAALVLITPAVAASQAGHDAHAQHMAAARSGGVAESGQSAFAAIAEIVRILEADTATDWTRVDLEALRQHLIDMDDVTLRSHVTSETIPGGARFAITGEGRVAAAIGRVVTEHSHALDRRTDLTASATQIAGGMQLTVTAERSADEATVRRIRGLGFAGLLVTDEHHAAHHLALAKGEGSAAHHR